MKFIAHRGYSAKFYQNSELAFIKAGEEKFFFGVETDIRLTKDRVWVCCHDDNPFEDNDLRVSEINIDVALSSTLKESKKGKADWDESLRICTLERYLEINVEYNMVPVIELKSRADEEAIKNLVELADRICGGDVIYIGYSVEDLLKIKKIRPDAKIQALCKTFYGARKYLDMGLDIDHFFLTFTKATFAKARNLGREVNVWTIRSLKEANKFVKLGVDYITTDYSYKGIFEPTLKK